MPAFAAVERPEEEDGVSEDVLEEVLEEAGSDELDVGVEEGRDVVAVFGEVTVAPSSCFLLACGKVADIGIHVR
jgi:hypothetical protein